MENLELIQKLLTAILVVLSFILGLMISYGIYASIDKLSSDNKKSKLSDYSALCFDSPSGIYRAWFTIGTKYPININECVSDNQGFVWQVFTQGREPKEGLITSIGSYSFVLIKKEDK